MKIFRAEPENEDIQDIEEFKENLEALETMLQEIRHIIGHRRTLMKNADKKLQEFQDTIYAILIEDEYPKKRYFIPKDHDDETNSSSS